jgi:hypothetical protein
MSDDETKPIPIKDLISEEGAHELAASADMQPYLQFMMAQMRGPDLTPHVTRIMELPLEKRYVWRIASSLKCGFADFDDATVDIDKQTLSPEDFARMMELLKFRPIQFCMILKALVGADEMDRLMNHAVTVAKQEG